MTNDQPMTMIRPTLIALMLAMSIGLGAQSIPADLFDELLQPGWTGELTYLDYSRNKEVKIPVNMEVTKIKEGTYQIAYTYPDEPKANSKAKIRISDDGSKLAGKKITSVDDSNGWWIITSEYKGSDNNEKAWLRITWTIGPDTFATKKEVKYKGDTEYFMRNEYNFSR
jgi:hypothetical protein